MHICKLLGNFRQTEENNPAKFSSSQTSDFREED